MLMKELADLRGRCGFCKYIYSFNACKLWYQNLVECEAESTNPLKGGASLGSQTGELREARLGAQVMKELEAP